MNWPRWGILGPCDNEVLPKFIPLLALQAQKGK